MDLITIAGICGVIVTLYSIYVEKTANSGKKAMCDMSENASCTVVLTSPYARLMKMAFNLPRNSIFNQPNTYYGLLFYVAVILYGVYPFTLIPFREYLLMGASIMSMGFCVVLAYILYFKLKNFCAVCVTSWVINAVILASAYYQL